jgi:hypothetical protein
MEAGDPSVSVNAERDALRVQAAAVAAQQTALSLEEDRLRQRAAALQAQEFQLASRLEERRHHLLKLQEQVRAEREALKSERAAVETEREQTRSTLARERNDVIVAAEQIRKERQRLRTLRQRLRARWRRHWDIRDAEHARRERELALRDDNIARKKQTLEQDRAAFLQSQGRFNGEIELERRRLRDAWLELSLAQQQWETCLNDENERRARQGVELDARVRALAASEQSHAAGELSLRKRRADLLFEIEGLETRAANARTRLTPSLRIASDTAPTPPAPAPRPAADAAGAVPAVLRRLAGDLGDQRRCLLEQWQRLLAVQSAREGERLALLADIEIAAKRLAERERVLSTREKQLAGREADAEQRRQAADRVRSNLEGWRVRLALREAAFDSERSSLLSEVRACAESASREAARMREAQRRWQDRRTEELVQLRAARGHCEEARSACLLTWQEYQQRLAALARDQRDLAVRSMAAEELRLELPSRANDAPAAERRLARLEHRNRVRIEAGERALQEGDASLQAEIAKLKDEWQRFQEADATLVERQDGLDRLRADLEKVRSQLDSGDDERAEHIRQLRDQHGRDQQELAGLKQELERIARHLIGDDEVALPEAERQAA